MSDNYHYLIYRIDNLLNGKFYIGAHKTTDIDDGYMGSGKLILRALNKYGVSNFKKTILHDFDNQEDMFSEEMKLVNEELVSDPNSYNIRLGGFGGWDHVDSKETYPTKEIQNGYRSWRRSLTEEDKLEHRKKLSLSRQDYLVNASSEELEGVKARMLKARNDYWDNITEEQKLSHVENCSKAKQRHWDSKDENYRKEFGNRYRQLKWITDGYNNRRIPKDDHLPEGWRYGITR